MNAIIERLIDAGHGEAATIAEWKDGLNEMWADLLELIDTRMQLLAASYDLHRYFYTGAEILGLIDEKHRELPEDVGLDASTAESFHRVHTAFERELHLLGVQVPLSLTVPRRFQDLPSRLPHGQFLGPPGQFLSCFHRGLPLLRKQPLRAGRQEQWLSDVQLLVFKLNLYKKPSAQNTLKYDFSGCAEY